MSACEICWQRAYFEHRRNPTKSQAEWYHELLKTAKHPALVTDDQADAAHEVRAEGTES